MHDLIVYMDNCYIQVMSLLLGCLTEGGQGLQQQQWKIYCCSKINKMG